MGTAFTLNVYSHVLPDMGDARRLRYGRRARVAPIYSKIIVETP
jgi:hypothetical protein